MTPGFWPRKPFNEVGKALWGKIWEGGELWSCKCKVFIRPLNGGVRRYLGIRIWSSGKRLQLERHLRVISIKRILEAIGQCELV